MPRWNTGELPTVPPSGWRNLLALIGPGIVMSASAIGGGEWLLGPLVTAKYGGALMWLAALSIGFQALYNIEISRYTLYCGEPIFSGKFRTLPGPWFWLFVYLLFDFSTVFPYLAASAVIPTDQARRLIRIVPIAQLIAATSTMRRPSGFAPRAVKSLDASAATPPMPRTMLMPMRVESRSFRNSTLRTAVHTGSV